MERIVHICKRDAWSDAKRMGEYRAPSLETEGFIHASRPDQILEVANNFYHGWDNLVLLWIDADRLKSELRWEPADGSLFPHIYGPINLETIIQVTPFIPDEDGVFRKY